MADGPGKYDDIALEVLSRTNATGVVLVIAGGTRGHGASVKLSVEGHDAAATHAKAADYMFALASTLRTMATSMEDDARRIARGQAHVEQFVVVPTPGKEAPS